MLIDNLIIIRGGVYTEIRKALHQWIQLYAEALDADMTFELYKNGRASHLVKADPKLDNERFNYLVNYLYYPEGVEYKISIEGFTTAKDEKLFPPELVNKKLLIYISEKDREGDNVFAVTENNDVYKIDFGGRIKRSNEDKTYHVPSIDFGELLSPEIIKLNKNEVAKNAEQKSNINLKKRFKILSAIVTVFFIVIVSALFVDHNFSFKSSFFLGFGLAAYLFNDYKMLQVDKYYFYWLLFSVIFFAYGLLIIWQFPDLQLNLFKLGSLQALSLLLVQRPVRLAYKRLLKREPVVERSPTFSDGVYIAILFFSLFILPLILENT